MSKEKKEEAEALSGNQPVEGSRRWVLVPDEHDSRRLLWEWEPRAEDDIDALFARVEAGQASEMDHELFNACMMDRFIGRVHCGQPIEPWILEALADAFVKILFGGEWNDEIRLPGRPMTPIRSPKDQRALDIYCAVANAINLEGRAVTEAIDSAAASHAVSYETARADYYKWKDWFSKKRQESQKDQGKTGE
ncbi:hypothetical protein [Ectopseudomonas mendocina]|uniref:hypothetical protein n=1 Tax=Ectopseudomonas mendocina TaxID=300 RepID=UPI003EFEDCBB